MRSSNNISKFIHNPWNLYQWMLRKGVTDWVPDELHLKLLYRAIFDRWPDFNHPQGFNEKLQWLKLHDHNPLYPLLVDKYRVKQWVSDRIGEKYVTKTYGSWERPEDIDFGILPEKFVLKTNHDCGGVAICEERDSFDFESAKRKLNEHLRSDYYKKWREWPYKSVKPLVFAEEYLEPDTGADDLFDYKFLCFDGSPKLVELHRGRFGSHTQDIYDAQWNRVELSDWGYPQSKETLEKPDRFEEMLSLSKMLSDGFPHVRVDWYLTHGRLLFGEMTFYDGAGFCAFEDYADDLKLGSLLNLPE